MDNISTNNKNGQHNEYIYHGDSHEHLWYDSKTGLMGAHGENASAEDKKWCGQRTGNMKIGGRYDFHNN